IAILEHLLHANEAKGRLAIIIDGADKVCPPTNKAMMGQEQLALLATLEYWGNDRHLAEQNNPILLLSPHLNEIHPDLVASDSGYKVIEQKLPDEATRRSYINWYLDDHRRKEPITLLDLTKEDLARNTAGLSLRQIEDILLLGALSEEEPQSHQEAVGVSRLLVKSRKDAIIRQQYSETVIILDPLPEGFAGLGGMEPLITFTREEVQLPLHEGRLQDVPKGILLVGPPGMGKTRYVEAMARELGYNALSLRMSRILGGIVGTSERNLQATFDLAVALCPTLLFIDELDQTHLAQRGTHSGSPVAGNLFGALLQFMGDEALRGRVIVIGATNHIEHIDPALLRPGRFDVIFPVLSPDATARTSVIAVQARLQTTTITPEAVDLITGMTEKYSPADLEAIIKEARFLARRAGHTGIHLPDAREALENIRPVTLATVDTFTRQALEACNNLRFLPPQLATQERERRRIAEQRRLHEQDTTTVRPLGMGARAARRL
ncbi:MAG: ATP-binding protein, partial [Ktedonobacteraceae bacterium]|nr:ATP-binding protein [Ktedonobacteraceae bacterium]